MTVVGGLFIEANTSSINVSIAIISCWWPIWFTINCHLGAQICLFWLRLYVCTVCVHYYRDWLRLELLLPSSIAHLFAGHHQLKEQTETYTGAADGGARLSLAVRLHTSCDLSTLPWLHTPDADVCDIHWMATRWLAFFLYFYLLCLTTLLWRVASMHFTLQSSKKVMLFEIQKNTFFRSFKWQLFLLR